MSEYEFHDEDMEADEYLENSYPSSAKETPMQTECILKL